MIIPYYRFDQIILVSALKSENNNIYVKSSSLSFKFSEYVKSQLHLNVVTDLYNRSIMDYAYAYSYLGGDYTKESYAIKVLEYFYNDLTYFLINNKFDIKSEVDVDIEFSSIKSKTVNRFEVEKVIVAFINDYGNYTAEETIKLVEKYNYLKILQDISPTNYSEKPNSSIIASILKAELESVEALNKIKIIGDN